jgi:ribosomal protein L11 methyltransferase
MGITWAEVSCAVPAAMVDQLAEFLVTLSGNGVCIENLAVDTFSLDTLEDSPVKTVKTYFAADAALPGQVAVIAAYLADQAAAFPGFAMEEPTVTYLQEEDWANNWKQHFKPSRIGRRMIIKPTWEEVDAAADTIILELDPGQAFGTGTHPTTRLCLETLERIYFREGLFTDPEPPAPLDLLDVGTGSGILAIAAARFGASRIVATDIDPEAVEVARQNLAQNRVQDGVTVTTAPLGDVAGTFAVVVANILAEELVRLAPALLAKMAPGSYLVLSGILTEKEDTVRTGFAPFPLTPVETSRDGEWSCLVYRRAG